MQKPRATGSKEIGLSMLVLQPSATRGNVCRRIVAPKGAGSSPVGHPPRKPVVRRITHDVRRILPYRERISGCLRAVLQRMAEAKSLRLLGREDEGHFGCTFTVYAPHRDVGATARVRPSLVLRHGF